MSDILQKPLVVHYTFAPNCPWINEKRTQLCRTQAELDDIKHLTETQPEKFRIDEIVELPC